MDNNFELQTDPAIANILNKLKNANKVKEEDTEQVEENNSEQLNSQEQIVNSNFNTTNDVMTLLKNADNTDTETIDTTSNIDNVNENKFLENKPLLWLNKEDEDTEYLHYLCTDDAGNIKHNKIDLNSSSDKIAKLKLTKEYLCDINYYKNNHFVLYVNILNGQTSYGNLYKAKIAESVSNDNDNDEDDVILDRASTNDIIGAIFQEKEYNRYSIFTDLGLIEFTASVDDVGYPYSTDNLNKWLEEVSNYSKIKCQEYDKYSDNELSSEASNIKDFKYDIITMNRPGVITLDSSSNNDSNYQVFLELKDEYSFIPLNTLLSCLKHYDVDNKKSIDDFKHFVDAYFNIIVAK